MVLILFFQQNYLVEIILKFLRQEDLRIRKNISKRNVEKIYLRSFTRIELK